MHVGIHQPNFLPWMGYFYKISLSDTFVFLDHVEYTKNSFTKRVKIHKPYAVNEDQYITVPLKKHPDKSPINELQIADDKKWQKKITAKIYETYHKAPFYHQIEPLISRFFITPVQNKSLSDFNIELIKYISTLLDFEVNWKLSTDLDISSKSKDVNLDIVTLLKGTTYLSGMGGMKYQDEDMFIELGLELRYSDYHTHFQSLNVPNHFMDKSIIAYLAHYPLDELKTIFL